MKSLEQIARDELKSARDRLARAEAVYNGFIRRRDDAQNRLNKLTSEVVDLQNALTRAAGEEREAIDEIAASKAAIAELEAMP